MKILYITYSCNPYAGSEDKIGWNIPYAASKDNEVWVITKEEQREHVEKFLRDTSVSNLHFFYVDIPSIYKKIYNGAFYSGRANVWHRRVFPLAKKLCADEQIKVIHQITPVEFRSIGKYKTIKNIKFICGPLGGGEYIPKGLKSYAKGHILVEKIRAFMNGLAKFKLALNGRLKKCDVVMYANYETKNYLKKVAGKNAEGEVITEIGVNPEDLQGYTPKQLHDKVEFLSAGRLVYRKGYDFLFDALEKVPQDLPYECRIVGGGELFEHLQERVKNSPNLSKHVVLTGKIPFIEMQKQYSTADVFVMPSIRETTGSVILEAMSYGLPVVALDKFGGVVIVEDTTGWLCDGKTKEDYIKNLAEILTEIIKNPADVRTRGCAANIAAQKYLWSNKLVKYS